MSQRIIMPVKTIHCHLPGRSGAVRTFLRTVAAVVFAAALLAHAGCRIPGLDGPVPQSLATCRQYSQRGVAALERGQSDDAETWLAKAVKACPVDPEARRHYAESLWQRGARQEAVVQLQEAGRLADDDAAIQVRLAEMHLAMGNLDLASGCAEKAIQLSPKSAAPWAARGSVQCAAGRLREALADYQRALAYAPDDRVILSDVADLYRRLNQPQQALQTLQTLAESYPPGEEPQSLAILIGSAYTTMGRYEDAIDALRVAADRGPPNAELYYRLAEADWSAGRAAEAAIAAQQALVIDPAHQPSRSLLGNIAVAQQQGATLQR